MFSDRSFRKWLPGLLFLVFCGGFSAWGGTLHLKDGMEWEDISNTPEGRRLMAVAKFKQLINAGDAEAAIGELIALKQSHPELAGPDFDKFVEAEFLYADGKWFKAAGKYKELMEDFPNSWLYGTAMERSYSLALAFLNGQKRKVLGMIKISAFDEGETIMRRLADLAGDGPMAKRALIALARGHEKRKEFLDAYEVWVEISTLWPTGEMRQIALLEMAQNLHSAYRGPDYDDTGLISAETFYVNYNLSYPELAKEHEVEEKLDTIAEQLAYKQYSIGEYYDRTGSREAAQFYYQEVVDHWPNTQAAGMAEARLTAEETGIPTKEGDTVKLGRTLFNISNAVVDSWFGATLVTGGKK